MKRMPLKACMSRFYQKWTQDRNKPIFMRLPLHPFPLIIEFLYHEIQIGVQTPK